MIWTMGKIWELPSITDDFTYSTTREIIGWGLEGEEPLNTTVWIGNGYKINIEGEVLWQNGDPLKPIFRKWKRSPIVIIALNIKDTNGDNASKAKEQRIDKLMEEYFWPYIEWYSEKKLHHNKEYIVVPKDGNWSDMSLDNIQYVTKAEYDLNWTTKALLIQLIPFFDKKSDEEIAELLSTSRWWVSRIKKDLNEKKKKWDEKLNKIIISHKTYQIHLALLKCKWLESNLEIAKKLRPKSDFGNKEEQGMLTDKVSRVRKKLLKIWVIEKYNTYQQKVPISEAKGRLKEILLANRELKDWKRKTHADIAKMLGLTLDQVNNYSRTLKK